MCVGSVIELESSSEGWSAKAGLISSFPKGTATGTEEHVSYADQPAIRAGSAKTRITHHKAGGKR
jgi:hypothetical protein